MKCCHQLALTMLLCCFSIGIVLAEDGIVNKVEPKIAGQGETVLLTITGEKLPEGTLVIEFYPQQIALLDILASNESEIQALVKVAHTAPPGKYNLMVYNQLGNEAFGSELLEVKASVITPVFKSYDPKTIADASSGFALLLTGEYVTAASVEHLSMEWQQNGAAVKGLISTFSISGNRAMVCAVEGQPPPGVLRGRVFLDGVPIYLVELTVEGGSAVIIGHTPAKLDATANPLKIRLLGNELTALAVKTLNVELSSTALTAEAQQVVLLDSASCQAEFIGPLPAGEYTLSVVSSGSLVYTSPANLTNNKYEEPITHDSENIVNTLSHQPEEESPISETDETRISIQPESEEIKVEHSELVNENIAQTPETRVSLRIEKVKPTVIDPSVKACRFTITTSGIDENLLQELTPVLTIDGQFATLLLSGSSASEMTCVFSPPVEGWLAGAEGELALKLSATGPASATYAISVGEVKPTSQTASAPAPGAIEAPIETEPGEAWLAQSAYISGSQGLSTLAVSIMPPQSSYELAQLAGSFTLLPDELGFASAVDNLALNGQLQFRQGENGMLIGEVPGNFISGSLMVTLRYKDGTPQLSMLHLDAPVPQLRIATPGLDSAIRSADGTWQPATLRWTVDVAPLILADTQFVSLLDKNGDNTSAVITVNGTQAVIECPTDSLLCDGELFAQMNFALPFKTSGALETIIPVQDEIEDEEVARKSTASGVENVKTTNYIELLEQSLHICDEGLWFIIAVPKTGLALAGWRELTIETSNVLLQSNIDKFHPEVSPVDSASLGQAIRILLRREKQTLSDDAYGLLCAQLLESGACQIKVEWQGQGYQLDAEVEFDESEWSDGGVLNELDMESEPAA